MNQIIERSLVLGLTRIFTAYGWDTTGYSTNFQDKVDTVKHGLYHGDAAGYLCHIDMLIHAREKDQNWGLYSPVFVYGIKDLLEKYGNHNDLFKIKKTQESPVYVTSPSSDNIFKHTPEGKAALARLRGEDRTNIRYSIVEEYGVDRILDDLHKAGYKKATVKVCYDTHTPSELREAVYDDGVEKMSVWYPIMPLVILIKK